MILPAAGNRYRRLLGGAVLALAALCAGCETPQSNQPAPTLFGRQDSDARGQSKIDPTRIETRDDIVQIIQYWPQMPWLQDGDRIVGFKVTVYFVSGETEKGAFVPGNIFVWVYELVPTAAGRRERKLAYGWQLDESEALGFRVTKRAVGGYFYGFPLKWPRELALEGKQVEIQFGYERANAQLVLSPTRRFRVPVPAGYQPPLTETEP